MENGLPEETIKEIADFSKKIEMIISDYVGFKVDFPVSRSSNLDEVDVGLDIDFPFYIKSLHDELIATLMSEIAHNLEYCINKTEILDADVFNTITYYTSLSLLFPNFINCDINEKYKIMKFIKDLNELGSLTYESDPVEIDAVLIQGNNLQKILDSIDVDFIRMSDETDIKDFFFSEKPFLRLIDSKSLTLVINERFKVEGILRKKSGGLSLNTLLMNLFDNYSMNDLFEKVQKTVIDVLSKLRNTKHESIDDEGFNVIHRYTMDRLKKLLVPENVIQPDFLYFSINDRQLNIYNPNNFVISNKNGIWKLKHYHLLFACVMSFIFNKQFPYLTFMDDDGEIINNLMNGMRKLASTIKVLSSDKVSSIITIVENEDYNLSLSSEDANHMLTKSNFKNNNLDKTFIEIIKNNNNHLNLLNMDQYLFASLASVDGTIVIDTNFNILSFGEVISVPKETNYRGTYGTGTIASRAASKYGVSLKISEDGDIKLFRYEEPLLNV